MFRRNQQVLTHDAPLGIDEPDRAFSKIATDHLRGAALDVFETEPLPEASALWALDNVIVSPHMSGDFKGYHETMAQMFIDNFGRYQRGDALLNEVDTSLGFVPSSS